MVAEQMTDKFENLQPLEEFVKHYVKGEWNPRAEFVVYNSPTHRFRITVEQTDGYTISEGFIGIWRDEILQDKEINVTCDDAKEFATSLLNTMFYHLSPHELMHIASVIDADLEEWRKDRGDPTTEPVRCDWS
jgi:hypothetical protein